MLGGADQGRLRAGQRCATVAERYVVKPLPASGGVRHDHEFEPDLAGRVIEPEAARPAEPGGAGAAVPGLAGSQAASNSSLPGVSVV